jgi:hypothetical protein
MLQDSCDEICFKYKANALRVAKHKKQNQIVIVLFQPLIYPRAQPLKPTLSPYCLCPQTAQCCPFFWGICVFFLGRFSTFSAK